MSTFIHRCISETFPANSIKSCSIKYVYTHIPIHASWHVEEGVCGGGEGTSKRNPLQKDEGDEHRLSKCTIISMRAPYAHCLTRFISRFIGRFIGRFFSGHCLMYTSTE